MTTVIKMVLILRELAANQKLDTPILFLLNLWRKQLRQLLNLQFILYRNSSYGNIFPLTTPFNGTFAVHILHC